MPNYFDAFYQEYYEKCFRHITFMICILLKPDIFPKNNVFVALTIKLYFILKFRQTVSMLTTFDDKSTVRTLLPINQLKSCNSNIKKLRRRGRRRRNFVRP